MAGAELGNVSEGHGQPDYSRAMKLFEDARKTGHGSEAKAVMDKIKLKYPKGTSAPPDEIEHGLEGILAKHGEQGSYQEHTKPEPTRMDYLMRLAAMLGGIAVFGMYL